MVNPESFAMIDSYQGQVVTWVTRHHPSHIPTRHYAVCSLDVGNGILSLEDGRCIRKSITCLASELSSHSTIANPTQPS